MVTSVSLAWRISTWRRKYLSIWSCVCERERERLDASIALVIDYRGQHLAANQSPFSRASRPDHNFGSYLHRRYRPRNRGQKNMHYREPFNGTQGASQSCLLTARGTVVSAPERRRNLVETTPAEPEIPHHPLTRLQTRTSNSAICLCAFVLAVRDIALACRGHCSRQGEGWPSSSPKPAHDGSSPSSWRAASAT